MLHKQFALCVSKPKAASKNPNKGKQQGIAIAARNKPAVPIYQDLL